MIRSKRRRNGWILIELVTSMGLLMIVMGGLILTLHAFGKVNRYTLDRRRCVAAGLAQIESIAATGSQMTAQDIRRLWPHMTLTVERTAGQGQWQGLDRIAVTAQTQRMAKPVTVEMARYLPPSEK